MAAAWRQILSPPVATACVLLFYPIVMAARQLVPVVVATMPREVRVRKPRTETDDTVLCTSRWHVNEIALSVKGVQKELRRAGVSDDVYDPIRCCSKVLGVALARADFIYHALKVLDDTQAMQRKFWALLSGGGSNVGHLFYWTCVDRVLLSHPLELQPWRGSRAFIAPLPTSLCDDLMDTLEEQLVGGLPAWLLEARPAVVARMPSAFAALLLTGATDSFSLCALDPLSRHDAGARMGWSLGFYHCRKIKSAQALSHFPKVRFDSTSVGQGRVGDQGGAENSTGLLLEDCFQDLADNTRRAFLSVAGRREDPDAETHTEALHIALETWQQSVDQMEAFRSNRLALNRYQYDMATLILAFIQAAGMKNDSDLGKACRLSLDLLLPKAIAKVVKSWMDDPSARGLLLPSPTTLSRLRGRIDTSFMLAMRGRIHDMIKSGGLVLYPAVDSSPQGGRDYEIVVLNILRKATLPLLYQDVVALESRGVMTVGDRLATWQEDVALMARIRDRIIHHMVPPGFLGTGRTSLAMKFKVTFHCLMLLAKAPPYDAVGFVWRGPRIQHGHARHPTHPQKLIV